MKHFKPSKAEDSESGWGSDGADSDETQAMDIENSTFQTAAEDSSATLGNMLFDIPLDDDDDSGAPMALFLNEDYSRDGSSLGMGTFVYSDNETISPDTVAGIVDEVLTSLQRARQEQEISPRTASPSITGEETVVNVTPMGLEELKHTLKVYPHKGADIALLRRIEDFHRARFLRRQQHPIQPWGIFGLFQYLSDLQLDLEWAEDAAWRRANGTVYLSWSDFQAIQRETLQPTYFVYIVALISTIMLIVSFCISNWQFAPIKVNPMLGPSPDALLRLGALERTRVIENNEWFRLVAPMFLHAGLVHFVLNMLALFFIGGIVERKHGTAEVILVFMFTGIGGNIASTLFMSPSISVGASGGIFGLLGVCLADIMINWDLLTLKNYRDVLDPAFKGFPYGTVLFGIFAEIAINVMVGLTPYVDQFAHVAGLLYGIGFGIPFLRWLKGPGFFGGHSRVRRNLCGLTRSLLFALTITSFVVMLTLLINSDGEPLCPDCQYISCLPFPFWKEETWWQCDECDLTVAKLRQLTPSTLIDLTCPGSEIVEVDLLEANVDRVVIQESLSGYCRQLCPI
jgi:membrane associated rhomboid family serine protease